MPNRMKLLLIDRVHTHTWSAHPTRVHYWAVLESKNCTKKDFDLNMIINIIDSQIENPNNNLQ